VAFAHRSAAGHVDDIAKHYNFFHPESGRGTANGVGFGWRGGGALVSAVRVPVSLSFCGQEELELELELRLSR
jgi:hypothetical protein